MYLQLKLHCCFLLTKKKLWKNEGLRNSYENCQTSFGDDQIKFVVFISLVRFSTQKKLEGISETSLMISRIRIFLPKHNLIFLLFLEIRIDTLLCPEHSFQLAMWQLKQKKFHILHSICSPALKTYQQTQSIKFTSLFFYGK